MAPTTPTLQYSHPSIGERFYVRRTSARSAYIQTGDKIVLYTDGVIECKNANGERFGLDNCQRLTTGNHSLTASDLLDKTTSETHSFIGAENIGNDITIVIAEVV